MSYKSNNSNNQHGNQYSNQYGNQYSNQYRPEYNNNNNNFNYINNNSSNNYGIKPYEMGEHAAINPRIQELSESDYVQSNQPQPYHGSLKRGSISNSSVSTATAIGTPQLRSVNNDDNVSVRSSIYSQPSTSDPLSRNNSKNHATNELANNGVYGDSRFLGNNMMIYPSSHQANSLVFNNNNNQQQQQPLIDRTFNLDNQNNYDSYNSNNSNNNQQQDVYNDYNNYHYPSQNQSYYNDQEATRHNSMTLPDNNNVNSSYDFHNGSKIDSEKENLNQPMMIDNTFKKQRKRCCCCSGVHCVIITFVILILLAVALFFVWPRIPTVKILDAKPVGTPSISQNPPLIYLDFVMRTQIDNKENWIPFRFNRIDVQVFDSTTISSFNKPIATGNITDYTLPPKQISEVGFPLNVNYVANDASDPVLQDFLSACTKQPGTQQTTLNLRVDVKLFVWGIDWIFKPAVSVPVNGIKCPYPQ